MKTWSLIAILLLAVLCSWSSCNERNQIDCKRAGGVWLRGPINDYCQ